MTDPFADLLSVEELSRERCGNRGQYQDINNGAHLLDDKASGSLGENYGRKGEVSELTV